MHFTDLIVSLFRYLNEFETFAEKHSDLVLNLYFEEIIKVHVPKFCYLQQFINGSVLSSQHFRNVVKKR